MYETLKLITKDGNIKRYADSDIVDTFNVGQVAYLEFPNGYGHGTRVSDISFTLTKGGVYKL